MELIKTNSQSKLVKSFIVIILGSIALTISAKIKNSFLSSSNDNADICCFVFGFKFWV